MASDVGSAVSSAASTVASDVESAVGTGIKAVESGVSAVNSVSQAFHLAEMAVLNPLQIPELLAAIAWDLLPAQVKAFIINRLLDACAELIPLILAMIDPFVPGELPISSLVVSAAQGFLTRARGFDDQTKIKVVDRFVLLWTNPSPAFTLGFLKGLLLGLWARSRHSGVMTG